MTTHFGTGSRIGSLVIVLATSVGAQVTQTATFGSPVSQTNSAGAAFVVAATVQSPGELASPVINVLGATSPSSTLAYTSFGSTTFPAPGSMSVTGQLRGTAGAPLILALSLRPGGRMCGGFAGWPCMTGPLLFGSSPTPYGLYHLDPGPILLLDGIGGSAPPAQLGPNGTFPIAASLVVDTLTNGGSEWRFAAQAAILDPTSPSGASFTAAFTVEQWVFYL